MRLVQWLLGAAIVLSGCAAGSMPSPDATPTTLAGLDPIASDAEDSDRMGVTTTRTASTTSTTALPTTSTTDAPKERPITITVAGDTSFTHGLAERNPLGDVAELLRESDLTILNVETTIAEPAVGTAIEKRFVFKSPPESAVLLADAGVDIAALANNHALDYGPEAVGRTIDLLGQAGVASAGTGATSDFAYQAIRRHIAGWDVAVLSFTRVPCDSPEPGETFIDGIAWACPEFADATMDAVAATAESDVTIVMVHWGVQSRACPEEHQWELARQWVERGADIVVGSHPHVLQGIAMVEDRWVLHSTGNFAFPSARNASADSALFTFTISEEGTELDVVPIRIVDGRPHVADASKQRIVDLLTGRSFGFAVDDTGRVVEADAVGDCG